MLSCCVRLTSALEKTVDGVTKGQVRSEKGRKALFHQQDDGSASFRSRGTLRAHPFEARGEIPPPVTDAKTCRMAIPPHGSRLNRLKNMYWQKWIEEESVVHS